MLRVMWVLTGLLSILGVAGCTRATYRDEKTSITIDRFHPFIDTKIGALKVLPRGGFEIDNYSSESVMARALAEIAREAVVKGVKGALP